MLTRIKIPEARIRILIGVRGSIKRRIEHELKVSLSIGDGVIVEGEDALNVMTAENIIKAIGRGFAPQKAFKLLDENVTIYILALPKNEKTLRRMKSRIIGEKGRAKANLERLTGTCISVYGKTVAMIGGYEAVDVVREAIENLMSGFSHASVYALLERKKREIGLA